MLWDSMVICIMVHDQMIGGLKLYLPSGRINNLSDFHVVKSIDDQKL